MNINPTEKQEKTIHKDIKCPSKYEKIFNLTCDKRSTNLNYLKILFSSHYICKV